MKKKLILVSSLILVVLFMIGIKEVYAYSVDTTPLVRSYSYFTLGGKIQLLGFAIILIVMIIATIFNIISIVKNKNSKNFLLAIVLLLLLLALWKINFAFRNETIIEFPYQTHEPSVSAEELNTIGRAGVISIFAITASLGLLVFSIINCIKNFKLNKTENK